MAGAEVLAGGRESDAQQVEGDVPEPTAGEGERVAEETRGEGRGKELAESQGQHTDAVECTVEVSVAEYFHRHDTSKHMCTCACYVECICLLLE